MNFVCDGQKYFESDDCLLIQGKMQDALAGMEPNSVDCIITDPPYELNFMGKGWDRSGVAFDKATWELCLKVLKPGGNLIAFGGSRTFARISCAIEDAGFEIRDTVMWIYGSGFPKSMDIGKAMDKQTGFKGDVIGTKVVDVGMQGGNMHSSRPKELKEVPVMSLSGQAESWKGYGTCLKPAFEPIVWAMKPLEGTYANNAMKYGVAGINIDAGRIPTDDNVYTNANNVDPGEKGIYGKFEHGDATKSDGQSIGRFPANVILTYDKDDYQEVCGGFPVSGKNGTISHDYDNNAQIYGKYDHTGPFDAYDDDGSAARYFYCAKATNEDRDEGLEDLELADRGDLQGGRDPNDKGSTWDKPGRNNPQNAFAGAGAIRRNIHPTVKPTALMQYLIKLFARPESIILDPFMGSGSTGKAAFMLRQGYRFIGVEMTDEYLPIAKRRILFAQSYKPSPESKADPGGPIQMSLFETK